MTLAKDRYFQTGLAGSFVIHVLALLFLVWFLGSEAGRHLFGIAQDAIKPEPEPEVEVTMIFPDQIIPPPLQPPRKAFIRTTQNEASKVKPAAAVVESDRNTLAASVLPPKADATMPIPTTQGNFPVISFTNSEASNAAISREASKAPAHATPLEMRPPAPASPPPLPPRPEPKQVAKAEPADDTPLKKMMEELDKESARLSTDRLPLEVRKPEDQAKAEQPPIPKPQIREPEDTMPAPPVPKAIPVTQDRQALAQQDKAALSNFTRTSTNKGAISREGENAVDAVATPMATYQSDVRNIIARKWRSYLRLQPDAGIPGHVKFRFYVDSNGVPQDLKILSDAREADPRMRELTLRAILDADIPPIPGELLRQLENGRIPVEYNAMIYYGD